MCVGGDVLDHLRLNGHRLAEGVHAGVEARTCTDHMAIYPQRLPEIARVELAKLQVEPGDLEPDRMRPPHQPVDMMKVLVDHLEFREIDLATDFGPVVRYLLYGLVGR